MENISGIIKGEDQSQMDLPPGFRFHPTDEELITHYLSKKVFDSNFNAKAIGEADLNKCEPWDLPWRAKMGEKQWYFFCVRDRKYPTGLRTNRATEAGYWKATGKDKAIYRSKSLVGMKKTLVFYKGRAPKGEKTNWVTHEFRLEGKFSPYNHPKTSKNEWVICRIFNKSSGCKKPYVSSLVRLNSLGDEMGHSQLPPLTDSPICNSKTKLIASETSHVTCFSNSMEDNCFNPPLVSDSSNPSIITNPLSSIFSKISLPNSFYSTQDPPNLVNLQYPNSVLMQDQSIWLALLENQMEHSCKPEREMISISQETGLTTDMNTESSSIVSNLQMGRNSFEDQGDPSTSVEPVDLDCIWNY